MVVPKCFGAKTATPKWTCRITTFRLIKFWLFRIRLILKYATGIRNNTDDY